MKKYVKNNAKYTAIESKYVNGKREDKYFYFFCDVCGARYGEIPVDELCEEGGFPDGDYCWNCQMSMREQGFVSEDKSIYFLKKDYPKSNRVYLDAFLGWAKNLCKKEKFQLKGFWTYDNDYFSWEYLTKLVRDKYILINEDIGKKPEPENIDVGDLKTFEESEVIKEIAAKNQIQQWYYKGKGKIFEKDVLKKDFRIRDQWVILNKFKQTKKILMSRSKKEIFHVHADWSGISFLILASLPGKTFHEKRFKITELYALRDFIEKEKPKGAVISYVTSDEECPIYDIDLSPILNLFDIPELQYLKLLFVSKYKTVKRKNSKYPVLEPIMDGKVEWVLAYSK